ncbi:MAG TPA: transglycosylase domain-containing protein [Terracidiphilus sp.]|nr:transglycosylase domain-containing protein [Terracidiphilus sp.]
MVKPPIKSFIESPNSSSRNGAEIDMIVLHCSTAATVEGTIHWFLNRNSRVSAHYIVDKNGDIYQMVRDDLSAWHAKATNARSIGIEHVATAADRLTDAQSVASAQLVRWLQEEYGIVATNVVGHKSAPGNEGTTDCPNHLFGEASAEAVAAWVAANAGAGPKTARRKPQAAAKQARRRAPRLPKWARPSAWFTRLRSDLGRIDHNVRLLPRELPASLTALELMTIALEDRRFFSHPGVDARSVLREMLRVLTGRKHGGASTIDMQFVRTVTGFRAPTLKRKIYEGLLAMAIQFRHKKIEILRSYLACAYFGSGLIGANAAAQRLFHKNADQLGTEEAALIAAMLAYPRPLQKLPRWEQKARRRAAYAVAVFARRKRRLAGPYEIAPLPAEVEDLELVEH